MELIINMKPHMKKHNIENWTLGGIVGTTVLSGILLSFPHAYADDGAVSNVAIRVNSACSVAVSPEGSNDTPHTADLNPGTYQANIGKTTIKTTCNDSNGFSIYAIGYTDEEYGNTVLKPDTVDSSNSIITGTATGAIGGIDTSNWAMKISAVSGDYAPTIEEDTDGSYSSFHVIPDDYTKVASHDSVTDATVGSSLEITYSAYISGTQPADQYNGKVKFVMVHPVTEPAPLYSQSTEPGKICYYSNGSNVEGTMGCQTIPASGLTNGVSPTSAQLLVSNFSRSGFGFAGWNEKFDYSGAFYGPNETISFIEGQYTGNNKGLSLYAVWVKSAGSLQDFEKVATLCGTGTGSLTQAPVDGTANLSSISALTDQRDNQTYAIAKLADGKCWMIENLRLNNTAELTLANTNNPLNDGTNVTLKHNYNDTTTHNTLSATSSAAYNADTAPEGWCATNSATCDDQSRLRTDNTATRAMGNPNTNYGSMYSYGNYYNWYSATAGRGTYSKSSGEAIGDLCPIGWKLPYGNGSGNGNTPGGFYYLNYKLNNNSNLTNSAASSKLRSFPNNFLYSGYVRDEILNSRANCGFYWSSTATSASQAYELTLHPSYVQFTSSNNKFEGITVRCVVGS